MALLSSETKSFEASPDPLPNEQFGICRGEVGKGEQHPEEGLYESVSVDFWKASTAPDGSIQEPDCLKKSIFFAGLSDQVRREAWPFLLGLYPWGSTTDAREQIRHDLFLQYQKLRRKRTDYARRIGEQTFSLIDSAIHKDVIRTDRKHPYYQGDANPHIDTMHTILLNYAAFAPSIGYIQGMSDLLAPLLAVLETEADAFWAFAALMQRSVFVSLPAAHSMDRALELLAELIRLLCPDFHRHLAGQGGDALSLMFAHRWILLCFKREFPSSDSLRLWEACWSGYGGDHFQLFVACAVLSLYGSDLVRLALPHDEILLYLASLAGHMDADAVFRKARGLLHAFFRLPVIPCTLGALLECPSGAGEEWEGRSPTRVDCVQPHGAGQPCPYRMLA